MVTSRRWWGPKRWSRSASTNRSTKRPFDSVTVERPFNWIPWKDPKREYVATIPIRTPGTYQVDAISRRSGLNNPFSPQYSISPVVDTPPMARWSETTPRIMIVSPLDVVPLAAIAMDDLPIDRVIQEFQINGEPALR